MCLKRLLGPLSKFFQVGYVRSFTKKKSHSGILCQVKSHNCGVDFIGFKPEHEGLILFHL